MGGPSAALALLAFVITFTSTPMVRRLALAFGAIAHGGGRHVHHQPTPRWGGMVIALGFFGALLLGSFFGIDSATELERFGWPVFWLVVGAMVVLMGGVADDLFVLRARTKLSFQLAAAGVAVFGGFGFHAFSNPFGGDYIGLGFFGPLTSVLWIIAITNAFNLIDGLDGLAAGVGLIAAITLLAVSVAGERPDAVMLFAALSGCLIAFLVYNSNPASIFLGDSGSLLLGYLLAVLSIQSLQKGAVTAVIIVPFLSLGLPIVETSVTVVRRYLVAGLAAVLRADRDHIHHRLLASGFTHRRAVMVLYGACSILGLLAYLAVVTRGAFDAIIVALVIALTIWGGRRLGYNNRRMAAAVGDDIGLLDGDDVRAHLAIVVLGDLGRSPRMAYHAWAAAESGFDVDLIGELETELLDRIGGHPHIRVHALALPPRAQRPVRSRIEFLARAALRFARQWFHLMRALHALPRLEVLLVQSPPAIPTSAVALAVTRQRDATLVIDWHNLGFAILAQRLGCEHALVRLMRGYEWRLGRCADAHLCVSQAMAEVLQAQLAPARVTVLHDRPAEHFHPLLGEQRQLARRALAIRQEWRELEAASTALAVSPSSFTADEDMALLFDALVRYGTLVRERDEAGDGHEFPQLLVALTGKGELRAVHEKRALELRAHRVSVRFGWIAAEHYPDLLGAADLGLCLHRSASGVDLPMKIADMSGAGLPVCAFDYGPCLREQIEDGASGLLFRDAEGLAQLLVKLLAGFPEAGTLTTLAVATRARASTSFADEWRRVALPLLGEGT